MLLQIENVEINRYHKRDAEEHRLHGILLYISKSSHLSYFVGYCYHLSINSRKGLRYRKNLLYLTENIQQDIFNEPSVQRKYYRYLSKSSRYVEVELKA